MSQKHTIFVPYHFLGRKSVVVIEYNTGKIMVKNYKTACDMPADLRHQYRCRRVAHLMHNNK